MTAKELPLTDRRAGLFVACEKVCLHECCGMGAFDFSPLHVASYMSAYTGIISEEDTQASLADLDRLLAAGAAQPLDANGYACSIANTNWNFTRESLAALVARIKWSIAAAPQVLECSARLEADAPAWPLEDF